MSNNHAPHQLPSVYFIDASIYIFRGWFVLPDTLRDTQNNPINAVRGFTDTLLKLIEQQSPTHIACAFDTSLGKSVREKIHPEYKANRAPAPDELKYQFALCRQFVNACGIAGFSSDSYEADDILGTLAAHAHARNQAFVVVTDDKDLTQLLGKDDYWWSMAKGHILDYRGVEKRFGVKPHQIADLLALSGDKSDNIIGIPGIGVTTAARLLKKWGTIDNLYQNIEKVGEMKFRGSHRIQSLLSEYRKNIDISRQLTPVFYIDELPDSEDTIRTQPRFEEELNTLFELLNFDNNRKLRWIRALENSSFQRPILQE